MRKKYNILIILILYCFNIQTLFSQREYPPCGAWSEKTNDTISVPNSYSSTLYVGIDNKIEINTDIIRFPFRLTTNNGIIYEYNSTCYIMPSKPITTIISLFPKYKTDVEAAFIKSFRVKRLPSPQLSLCDLLINNIEKVDRKFLLSCNNIDAFYTDDLHDSNELLQIIRFSIGYNYGSFFIENTSVNNLFTNQMKNLIRKVPPGQYLIISVTCLTKDNVKIVLPNCNIKVY